MPQFLFFDDKAVASKVDPAIARQLAKFGAFVRRRAKSSLKYAEGAARPGQPPHVHRSAGFIRKKKSKGVVKAQPASPLRELLFFGYDPVHKSCVVGPMLGGPRTGAPDALEHGRFPFMAPALAGEADQLDGLFTSCVR